MDVTCIRCGNKMLKNKCEEYCTRCGFKIDCSDHVGLDRKKIKEKKI